MKNIKAHFIYKNATVRKAMEQINKLPKTLTLFVINEDEHLLGTLTDGDIRRGFINGKGLEDYVEEFMKKDFYYQHSKINVHEIKHLKEKGIRLLPILNNKNKIEKVYDLQSLHSVLPLDAVIMAGGRGERLRPITDKIPKPMIPIGGKPLIEYIIEQLISYGIENIYISVNYLKEQIKNYLGNGNNRGINIHYIEEDKPLGTAGALSLVDHFSNDILLLNSDLFTNVNYEDLYVSFIENNSDLSVASIPYTVNIPYAILEGLDGKIEKFKEKPSNTHYANSGIYILKKELQKEIPFNTFYNATDLMQYCIDNQKRIIHNPLIGYWIDIGKVEDLQRAKEIIKHI